MYSLALTLCWIMCSALPAFSQFFVGFYNESCPNAEATVRGVVRAAMLRDASIAGALLRLHFHDCFVLGCDASVLLDEARGYAAVEKAAGPNLTLRGYEVIDVIKSILEAVCPGIVSCADILALAARDSVLLSGGPSWDVPTGRKDGRISSARLAVLNLPLPTFDAAQLTQSFASHGLSQEEMIALSGAHTIGMAHCSSFVNRLYAYNESTGTDPSIDPAYAELLKQLCPPNGNAGRRVPIDPQSPFRFDVGYYRNLRRGRGLLISDQQLHSNESTRAAVVAHLSHPKLWQRKFVKAMLHLGSLQILSGSVGEIRGNCRLRNP